MKSSSNLETLINPSSIAIIGVSEHLNKIGGRPLKFLLKNKYKGEIFPVNPKYEELHGLKCYSKISDIKKTVDLAVIALPATFVAEAVESCALSNVKSVVIFSSGFAEIGAEGKKIQNKITKISKDYNINICGPNSVGIVNIPKGVGATMSQILEQDVTESPVALLSQSGAYGTFIAALAEQEGLGFNYFIATGNEADLEFSDYTEYLVEQEDVKMIAGYIEGIRNVEKMKKAALLAAEHKKPITVIKVGRSEIGKKAASSHTGSITGSDNVYNAFFNQYGILRVNNEEEMLDLLIGLNSGELPKGRGVGILSMSGGAGIQIADEIEETGLKVVDLEDKTQDRLKEVIPNFGSVANPVDITGQVLSDPKLLTKSINILNEDKNVDIIVFFLGLGWSFGDKIAEDLIEISKRSNKTIAVSWVAGQKETIEKLRKHKIKVFSSVTRTIQTLDKLITYKEFLEKFKIEKKVENVDLDIEVKELLDNALKSGRNSLSESESKRIFSKYDIPVPREKTVNSKQDAVHFANEIGYPVVAKINSPSILHKSDANTVKLNILDDQELGKAYDNIIENALEYNPDAEINGVLVEEMISGSTEIIIGVTFDEQFGPVIMFGLGGVYVELFKDFSLRIAPLTEESAMQMIKETKAYEILKGYRGSKKMDIDAIIKVLLNVSKLSLELKDYVSEIDINPILVKESGEGVMAADALIILKDN